MPGVNERYAREWLEQQAMAGSLETEDSSASDTVRRYVVPTGHEEVLLDAGSLNYMAPMAQLLIRMTIDSHRCAPAGARVDSARLAR